MHKYKYTNKEIQIQKYKYTNTQIRKYKNTSSLHPSPSDSRGVKESFRESGRGDGEELMGYIVKRHKRHIVGVVTGDGLIVV